MQLTRGKPAHDVARADDSPLEPDEFASLVEALGPFEPGPHLAIAVSGGRDSLALALFADAWARRHGGTVTALTVDHGIRSQSGREAALVGSWLRARGIAHEVLELGERPPQTGIEAWAREARYDALQAWCRARGVLHLLVAHHREDQGETWLMRTARGTGPAGAAAMPAIRETADLRILRPLLGVPRARITATLEAAGIAWLEDPMNADPRYERVALRRAAADDSGGYAFTQAAAEASVAGERRARDDTALAAIAARCLGVHQAGYATLVRDAFLAADPVLADRLLARCVAAVGGRTFPPRRARLARLSAALRKPGGGDARTLAGCRIVSDSRTILICREPAASERAVALGMRFRWDNRFVVSTSAAAPDYRFGALGAPGWREVARECDPSTVAALPVPVRASLPAVFREGRPVCVPALALSCEGAPGLSVRFSPPIAIAGGPFGNAALSFDD